MSTPAWDGGFVRGAPSFARALNGLSRPDAGAIVVLAPTARDVDLWVVPQPKAGPAFRRALRAGRSQGAVAGRIWHGTGRIRKGRPMVIVAAAARSRKDALVAVEIMLNALKGVALRRDES